MSPALSEVGFQTANPHALAIILEASETRSIIAARDIFDINGMKLWARDQPVSRDLQRKLMDRALQQPLETCLMAEDGITADTLRVAVQHLRSVCSTPILTGLPFGHVPTKVTLPVGARVQHARFGTGTIIGIAEDTLTVQFDSGFKTVKAPYVQPADRAQAADDVPF